MNRDTSACLPSLDCYAAKRFNLAPPEEAPQLNQERACASPFWYTPEQ